MSFLKMKYAFKCVFLVGVKLGDVAEFVIKFACRFNFQSKFDKQLKILSVERKKGQVIFLLAPKTEYVFHFPAYCLITLHSGSAKTLFSAHGTKQSNSA